jgi:hypothetical protein
MLRRILMIVGALVVVLAVVAVFMIGPRNVIGMIRYDKRDEGKLHVGDPAPDVALTALDGTTAVNLREHVGSRPLILVFGSYT